MPIRLVSQASSLGRLQPTLGPVASSFTGSVVAPGTFTGTLGAAMQNVTAALSGNVTASSNYTGTIAATLGNVTGAFFGGQATIAGPFNVFPLATDGSHLSNDTGITNSAAVWRVVSETPLDGSFSYNQSGFTYTSGTQIGAASFVYEIINFDGLGTNSQATVTVDVVPWDLWGSRSAPAEFSSLSWPTSPAATNQVTANSIAELNSLAVSGNVVTLTPGSYSGTINLTNPDVHIILTGCTITSSGFSNPSASGSRIRVDGGRIFCGGQNVFNGSDLYFNNVRVEASGFSWADSIWTLGSAVQRMALVRCSIINNDANSGRVVYQLATGGTSCSDLIIAGTELLAQNATNPGQWAARINGCTRTVIVDSRLEVVSPSQSGRYHADDNAVITGYYSARNEVIGGTWNNEPFSSTGFTGGSITGVYFYDNDFYRNDTNGQLAFQSLGTGSMSTVRVENTTHYTQQNGGSGNMQIDVGPVSDYSASNNVRAPYQTPGTFAYGSDQ